MGIDARKKLRRRMMTIGLISAMLAYGGIDHVYVPQYEILEHSKAFARYSKGNIYIGSRAFLNSLKDIQPGDILVLDQRKSNDPNMKIFASSEIRDKNIRNEILEVLCRYEECYPSDWDRTIESMRLEWLMHNLSYDFNHEQHRTYDVDLNNGDQEYYDNIILNKIFKL